MQQTCVHATDMRACSRHVYMQQICVHEAYMRACFAGKQTLNKAEGQLGETEKSILLLTLKFKSLKSFPPLM